MFPSTEFRLRMLFTFQNHFDSIGDGADFIPGAAVVDSRLIHLENVSRHKVVLAVEPLDLWRRVTVSDTDKILDITSEQRDCVRKICGINAGLIC